MIVKIFLLNSADCYQNNHNTPFCDEGLKFGTVIEEATKSKASYSAKYHRPSICDLRGFYAFILQLGHKMQVANIEGSLYTR